MDFTIPSQITKDFLFSKVSEENIFCNYLKISNISKKLVRNITRTDRRPTCGFYRNQNGTLIMHDFATGEYFNCISLVMKLYKCSYHKALDIIASDFGIIDTDKPPKVIRDIPKFEDTKITQIQVELTDFTDADLKWWNQYGISKKTLAKYRVFCCKSIFLNGELYCCRTQSNPIYGYYFGRKGDLEQWRIYFPKRNTMRFMGNVSTKTIQGFKQLPQTSKLLVITKSMKDTMVLYELGIASISPNSETQFVSDKMMEELRSRFKYIVLLYDNDETGIVFSNKIHKKFPFLNVFFIPKSSGAKDISDYYKMYGLIETQNLIKQGINYLKSKLIK